MPERYLWVPEVLNVQQEDERNGYPRVEAYGPPWADFDPIEDDAPGLVRTSALKIIDGVGRVMAASGPADSLRDMVAISEVIDIGATYLDALAWAETAVVKRAADLRAHLTGTEYRTKRSEARSLSQMLTRALPDQFRKQPKPKRTGTFTEDYDGSDDDPWPSPTDYETYWMATWGTSGAGSSSYGTWSIQGSIGNFTHPGGGLNSSIMRADQYEGYGTMTACNMLAHYGLDVWKQTLGPYVRGAMDESGTSDCYMLEQRERSGNDHRLYRIVNESATEIESAGTFISQVDRGLRVIVDNDGSGDPDIDGYSWALSGSEPGTPTLTHIDTDAAALASAGYAGAFFRGGRSANWDQAIKYELTNNDAAAAGGFPFVRRFPRALLAR